MNYSDQKLVINYIGFLFFPPEKSTLYCVSIWIQRLSRDKIYSNFIMFYTKILRENFEKICIFFQRLAYLF